MESLFTGDAELDYRVDVLFRSDHQVDEITPNHYSDFNATLLEVRRIFAFGLHVNGLPIEDQRYLAHVIANETGLPLSDAGKRVNEVFAKTHAEFVNRAEISKQVADNVRKSAAYSALWMFVALLSGYGILNIININKRKSQNSLCIHALPTLAIQIGGKSLTTTSFEAQTDFLFFTFV